MTMTMTNEIERDREETVNKLGEINNKLAQINNRLEKINDNVEPLIGGSFWGILIPFIVSIVMGMNDGIIAVFCFLEAGGLVSYWAIEKYKSRLENDEEALRMMQGAYMVRLSSGQDPMTNMRMMTDLRYYRELMIDGQGPATPSDERNRMRVGIEEFYENKFAKIKKRITNVNIVEAAAAALIMGIPLIIAMEFLSYIVNIAHFNMAGREFSDVISSDTSTLLGIIYLVIVGIYWTARKYHEKLQRKEHDVLAQIETLNSHNVSAQDWAPLIPSEQSDPSDPSDEIEDDLNQYPHLKLYPCAHCQFGHLFDAKWTCAFFDYLTAYTILFVLDEYHHQGCKWCPINNPTIKWELLYPDLPIKQIPLIESNLNIQL
jgi:positive regulator of sigma E activity